jgi:hypothetical protein
MYSSISETLQNSGKKITKNHEKSRDTPPTGHNTDGDSSERYERGDQENQRNERNVVALEAFEIMRDASSDDLAVRKREALGIQKLVPRSWCQFNC